MNFQKYIDLSLALFDPNYPLRCQHFTFVTKNGGKILAIGRNQNKFHSLNIKNPGICKNGDFFTKLSICSEFSALNRIKNTTQIKYNKLILFNIRIDRNKKICLSRPCNSCKSLLNWLGIKKIYYTDENGHFIKY